MKIDEVKNIVFGEMGFEVGKRKDGTAGYRSVVNGNMTDETPPVNKKFADAVLKILEEKKLIGKLDKFDLSTIDIESTAGGGAVVNFEDGTSMKLSSMDVGLKIKEMERK